MNEENQIFYFPFSRDYTDEILVGAYEDFLKDEDSHFHFDDSTRKAAEKLGIPEVIISAVIYCYTIHDTVNLRIIKYNCLKTMSYEEWNELTVEAREQASRLTWAGL